MNERTDAERLDLLEAYLAGEPEHARITLLAWYSKPGKPDGFAADYGDEDFNGEEHPTLRVAIDTMLDLWDRYPGEGPPVKQDEKTA